MMHCTSPGVMHHMLAKATPSICSNKDRTSISSCKASFALHSLPPLLDDWRPITSLIANSAVARIRPWAERRKGDCAQPHRK